ncbi:MAG: hypothetical protein NZ518_04405 [Dehalococcoidia bacterium]|nr:hypothetical protein [Dehalococcoidia bacterium]
MYVMRSLWQVMPGRFVDYEAMSQRAADVMLAAPAFVDGQLAVSLAFPIRYLTLLNWEDWPQLRAFMLSEPWIAFNRSETEAGRLAAPVRPQESFDRFTLMPDTGATQFYLSAEYTLTPQVGSGAQFVDYFNALVAIASSTTPGLCEAHRFRSYGNPARVATILGFDSLAAVQAFREDPAVLEFVASRPVPAFTHGPVEEDVYAVVTRYRR